MNRPVHFEFHSADPARTNAFFSSVFGWAMAEWTGGGADWKYWTATTGRTGPGIDGGVMPSRDGQQRTVNTIEVDDVDQALARITAAGGTPCVPKMPIPGVGYLAYATDPTGVLFGIMHMDPAAR